MTKEQKAILLKISDVALVVADKYAAKRDHDGDLIADAFEDFSKELCRVASKTLANEAD